MVLRRTLLILLVAGCSAFAPRPSLVNVGLTTSLSATTPTTPSSSDNLPIKHRFTAGLIAASLFLNSFAVPAIAVAEDFGNTGVLGDSSTLLAARSGGRAGGRAAYRPSPSSSRLRAAPTTTYRSSSTTIIRPTIAPPPIVVAPFGGGYGYGGGFGFGGSPLGGFGLGYGLGSINSAGDAIRDIRQESEIQQSKIELEQAKAREAELEARLKALEQAQIAK